MMKNYLSILAVTLMAVALCSGCSSVKELNSAIGEAASVDDISTFGLRIIKNKTTQSEIFKAIGAPGMVFDNMLGGKSWVYPRVAVRKTNLGFQASGNFSAIFPYSGSFLENGGGAAGVKLSSSLDSNKASYKTAGLLIIFNKLGCVNSYEFSATSF